MTAEVPGRRGGTIEAMIRNGNPTCVLSSGLLLLTSLTAGCSGLSASTDASSDKEAPSTAPAGDEMSPVLLLGDSVAVGQALPIAQAFEASDVEFESMAAEGGGNVVGPGSEEQWEELSEQIASAEPGVVIYQITSYDWGSEEEQSDGYETLLTTVTEADAELVFVTMPPIEPDDFYEPHMPDLERAPDVAREVAENSDGQAHVLDASVVWGDSYKETKDGKADRSPDGIHTCPQGAARFTNWLLAELSELYPGFTPASADEWADSDWAEDDHFGEC